MFYANYVSIVSSQTHVGIIPLLDEECLRPGEVSTVFLTSTFSPYNLIFTYSISEYGSLQVQWVQIER